MPLYLPKLRPESHRASSPHGARHLFYCPKETRPPGRFFRFGRSRAIYRSATRRPKQNGGPRLSNERKSHFDAGAPTGNSRCLPRQFEKERHARPSRFPARPSPNSKQRRFSRQPALLPVQGFLIPAKLLKRMVPWTRFLLYALFCDLLVRHHCHRPSELRSPIGPTFSRQALPQLLWASRKLLWFIAPEFSRRHCP